MKMVWPHVAQAVAILSEQREMAFIAWRASGYRDITKWEEFLRLRERVMQIRC